MVSHADLSPFNGRDFGSGASSGAVASFGLGLNISTLVQVETFTRLAARLDSAARHRGMVWKGRQGKSPLRGPSSRVQSITNFIMMFPFSVSGCRELRHFSVNPCDVIFLARIKVRVANLSAVDIEHISRKN